MKKGIREMSPFSFPEAAARNFTELLQEEQRILFLSSANRVIEDDMLGILQLKNLAELLFVH